MISKGLTYLSGLERKWEDPEQEAGVSQALPGVPCTVCVILALPSGAGPVGPSATTTARPAPGTGWELSPGS